jgi:putative PEP-CTERM system histidine kinase
LLLTLDEAHRLTPASYWNWHEPAGRGDEQDFLRFVETQRHVVDFSSVKDGFLCFQNRKIRVPEWMTSSGAAWAGVPLLHSDRLIGFLILAHPLVRRPLDWEDFDLFRTAGTQAASYLAEARSHDALADVQRFDDFNRRFAFIMHDIKNLVSQLSLVARNAERHAENPEFRADMIATLQSSVKKMNDLLARLSRGSGGESEPLRATKVLAVAEGVARTKQRAHPIELFGSASLQAQADPARLEQALAHLVQNAIDASARHEPVRISCGARGGEILIEVSDRGCGMPAEFIRTRLFQPFASTKESGFGIGAFEARSLVMAIGGRLEVESREGEGTRFTIFLPAARADATPELERMRA